MNALTPHALAPLWRVPTAWAAGAAADAANDVPIVLRRPGPIYSPPVRPAAPAASAPGAWSDKHVLRSEDTSSSSDASDSYNSESTDAAAAGAIAHSPSGAAAADTTSQLQSAVPLAALSGQECSSVSRSALQHTSLTKATEGPSSASALMAPHDASTDGDPVVAAASIACPAATPSSALGAAAPATQVAQHQWAAPVAPPTAVLPIAALPQPRGWLAGAGAGPALGVVEAPHACFSLPGMLGTAGRQYIQVVDLSPEHLPPVETDECASPAAAWKGADTVGGPADDDLADSSGGQPRPSNLSGAWDGRGADADEVVAAAMREAEATLQLSSLQEAMARLERQADALEVEIGGVGLATEAVQHAMAARQLGGRAGLLGKLGTQVEDAIRDGMHDLQMLGTVQSQLSAARALSAESQTPPPGATTSPSRIPVRPSPRLKALSASSRSTPRPASTTHSSAGGRARGGAPPPNRSSPREARPAGQSGSTGPAHVDQAASSTTAAAANSSAGGGAADAGRGSGVRRSSGRPGASRSAARGTADPTRHPGGKSRIRSGSSGVSAPRQATSVAAPPARSAPQPPPPTERQMHLDKRLARAEATLSKLLLPIRGAEAYADVTSEGECANGDARARAEGAWDTPPPSPGRMPAGQSSSPRAQSSLGTPSRTTPKVQHARGGGLSGLAPSAATPEGSPLRGQRGATIGGGTDGVASGVHADSGTVNGGRRAQKAAVVAAEANLLDAMRSAVG